MLKCKRPTSNPPSQGYGAAGPQRPMLKAVRLLTLAVLTGYFAAAQSGGVAKW